MCAGFGRREIPADDGAMRWVGMPIRIPGLHNQPRRIDLEKLAVMLEAINSARILAAAFFGNELPLATWARVHFPENDFEGVASTPLQRLLAIDDRLKDALGRNGDFDFGDDGVVVGSDLRFRGDSHLEPRVDRLGVSPGTEVNFPALAQSLRQDGARLANSWRLRCGGGRRILSFLCPGQH